MKRDDVPAGLVIGEPLLALAGADVSYGAVQALQDIHLTLHRGERLALVGANGAGKTTLLRLMHGRVDGSRSPGLPRPAGRPLAAEQRPAGRPLVSAMLFQRPFLLHLTVRQNVLLALWLRRVPGAERAARCETALARVGLLALAARPARSLSGGQQQRLALARAWGLQPDILFLDEPTANLDPSGKREVETLIEQLAADGVTLVMSTHNLGQAKRLASRVLYLDAGRLLADLPVARFFDPHDPPAAAAAFLKGELPWT